MDATVWRMISIIGYFLACVFLVAAIILFFKMNIRTIIGDLTGKTAARQIQEIRERNLMTGNQRYKPAAFQLERGTWGITGNRTGRKVGKTAQALAHASKRLDLKAKTGETSKPMKERSEGLSSIGPTAVLYSEASDQSSATEVLPLLDEGTDVFLDRAVAQEGTKVVLVLDDGTGVLPQKTVLYPTEELKEHERVIPTVDFKIVKDIKIVHTNEMI
jgi:hypothetical protein